MTRYRLGVLVHQLYVRKEYKGEALAQLKKGEATSADFHRGLRELEDNGILLPYPGFGAQVYGLLGRKDDDAEEVACSIDPFCYVSHLSAMAYHGLTNRIPSKIFLSSPPPVKWREFARERMRKNLGDDMAAYIRNGMPQLTRGEMAKIKGLEVHRFSSSHLGAYKNVRDKVTRMATLGRTFLDMLRDPDLCGGMRHVVEVFQEHGAKYQQLIIDEIQQHGAAIDKVRAGYLLEEELHLKDPAFDDWVTFAQRGGSRKLDAAGEYRAEWSDRWCLSLNL